MMYFVADSSNVFLCVIDGCDIRILLCVLAIRNCSIYKQISPLGIYRLVARSATYQGV